MPTIRAPVIICVRVPMRATVRFLPLRRSRLARQPDLC